MSLISENVIPGNHGRVFIVDVPDEHEFDKVKGKIEKLEGVKDVLFDQSSFPHEVTIHSTNLVKVKDIQDLFRDKGYHAVPSGVFAL